MWEFKVGGWRREVHLCLLLLLWRKGIIRIWHGNRLITQIKLYRVQHFAL